MARISSQSVEHVRQSVDMVEVVSRYTDLRKAGARYTGLCPFHDERTPSFSVDPALKVYHCFGCGVGGDVFGFVQEKEGLGFTEAVEVLGERFGVELEREKEDPQAEARRLRRDRVGKLLERTGAFYAAYLWESEEAKGARSYLLERGLSEETLREFRVGYAPSAWDRVLVLGQRAGFKVEEMRDAGLVQKGRNGGDYDRFRKRITFPISDRRGRVVGFGARAMTAEQGAKYINTAETEVFRKSRMLYGLDRAKTAIAKAGRAVVVEGYTDVIALHGGGVEEAVGVMGTAITDDQVAVLSGMVEEVVLALDADSAGQEAMLRAQRVAAGRKMRLRVAAMPAGEDPAEMLAAEGGAERFRELVEGAVDLPEFRISMILGRTSGDDPAERDRALAEAAPVLAAMPESAARAELERRLANELRMDPALVRARIVEAPTESAGGDPGPERGGPPGGEAPGPAPRANVLSSRERRERALLAMCIALPKEGAEMLRALGEEHLSASGAESLRWLRVHLEDPTAGLPNEGPLAGLIPELVMVAKSEPASMEAMEVNFLQLEQQRLEAAIAEAGRAGDAERRAELSRERNALLRRLAEAQQAL